jgi:predicted TIM-barrel fold metal-dependent hydrolase
MTEIIDSSCSIGMATVPGGGSEFSFHDLIQAMDLAEIDRALVYHTAAKEHDPDVGNRKLMNEISEERRMIPAWVLLPHHAGDMGEPEEVIGRLLDAGARVARLFPKAHNFSLSSWGCGPLLDALEVHRIPTMIDLGQTDFDAIQGVCSRNPDLPIILSDVAYRSDRYIYPLLEQCGNLHIETARYQTHRGVEAICARFGSSRLIFGSRAPELSPGPMAMTVRYARIDRDSKERILGGNLLRLMEGVRK